MFVNNKEIYNKANLIRIDNFIIQLCRDYYQRNKLHENPIIKPSTLGYLPPESFIFFDSKKIIQNREGTPLIYHIPRHQANKNL